MLYLHNIIDLLQLQKMEQYILLQSMLYHKHIVVFVIYLIYLMCYYFVEIDIDM